MSYTKRGKDRHWFWEFIMDFLGCLGVGIILAGISVSFLWIAYAVVSGITGGR